MSASTAARPPGTPGFPELVNPRRSTFTTGYDYGFDEPHARSLRDGEERFLGEPPSVLTVYLRWDDRRDEFGRIVSPRLARLRRLALKILRSEDLADDAVQEVLLSLWHKERLPRNLDGWLVRAVVHRSLHLNRTRQRRRKYEERASLGRPECDPNGDASRPLESAEVVKAVEAALGRLPDHLRTVFVLREGEQMDYCTIAEAICVPIGTVRSRLFRRERL